MTANGRTADGWVRSGAELAGGRAEPAGVGDGPDRPMRTVLICHAGAPLDREVLSRWLASFSELAGVVVLQENKQRVWRRIRREMRRVGGLRFVDVLAFRVYYRLFLAQRDRAWEADQMEELQRAYPTAPVAPLLFTDSPNSTEAERFVRECRPDIMLARCKTLLQERIFTLPAHGTFVMHPGICPEYRNAHGCFWALANGDSRRVGMTLLRVDAGVDTGPVYGYYRCQYDPALESHVVIQHRVVLENLPALASKLQEIYQGRAVPLDTAGRQSATWGQPWLSRYLAWKRRARAAAPGRAAAGEPR